MEWRTGDASRLDFHVPDGMLRRIDPAYSEYQISHGRGRAQGEQLRPQIQSEAGLRVLDYLHKLKEVSPPDILEMDWDRRTISFLLGSDRARVLLDRARGTPSKTISAPLSSARSVICLSLVGLGAFRTTHRRLPPVAFPRIFRKTGSSAPLRRSPG